MFKRIARYTGRHFPVWKMMNQLTDWRKGPTHTLATIIKSVMVMHLTRLGSVHALHQTAGTPFWLRWLGAELPGEDTIRSAMKQLAPDEVRDILHAVYTAAKRKKMLQPLSGNWQPLIVDAMEIATSYLRGCDSCCHRKIKRKKKLPKSQPAPTAPTEKAVAGAVVTLVQNHHREVLALLPYRGGNLLLDFEPVRNGEGELAAATRLFNRVRHRYPRAFNLVLGDALYANAPWFNRVKAAGFEALAVFKQSDRALMRDFMALCKLQTPLEYWQDGVTYAVWDGDGFQTWPQMKHPVRVVRSRERRVVTRQGTGAKKLPVEQRRETIEHNWVWVTTLPMALAKPAVVIMLGHGRWLIENKGFNELVNEWHARHVYTHHPTAILNFLLLVALAYNLFHLFVQRNLKPVWRKKTRRHIADLITAGFLAGNWSDDSAMAVVT